VKKYGLNQYLIFTGLLGVFPAISVSAAIEPSVHRNTHTNTTARHYEEKDVKDLLGWVDSTTTQGSCRGYYVEPLLNPYLMPGNLAKMSPVEIKVDHADFSTSDTSKLSGHVVIEQGDRELKADTIYLYRNAESEIDSAELIDNVSLREPGKLFLGDWATLNMTKKTATIKHVLYRLAFAPGSTSALPSFAQPQEIKLAPGAASTAGDLSGRLQVKLDQLNAWGYADEIDMPKPHLINFSNASYTTCPPNEPVWKISSDDIKLNRKRGRGKAKHIKLSFNDVPVLYLPYFNFPIDNRRSSGFLFPSLGYSSTSGTDIEVPYYFNLAPNYDFIFSPRYMSDRGLQLNGKLRYLTPKHQGQLKLGFLPDDREFADFQKDAQTRFNNRPELSRLAHDHSDRGYVSFDDSTIFNTHWNLKADYNWVSDDYYFQDLGSDLNTINNNQLERLLQLNYQDTHWDFISRVQDFQTLHPVNQAPIKELYRRLPQLYLTGQYPNHWLGMDYHWLSEFVNFDIRRNPGQMEHPVTGQRVFVQTGFSQPNYFNGGYFTPSLYVQGSFYSLTSPGENRPDNPSRALPIFNIDTGMRYTRDTTMFGNKYLHTLEPRLFYLFVPFVEQNNLPVFDTTIQPFNFEHLFRLNRFDGFDRQSDANQVTLALTSRLIEESTGDEKLRASIGQIFYFRDRNVQLCDTHDCQDEDNPTLAAVTSTTKAISPLVAELHYHIQDNWWLRSGLAWDVADNAMNNGNFYLQYHPSDRTLVNMGYVYIRDGDEITTVSRQENLNQTDFSFALPISTRVSAIGRWNYNISHHYLHAYVAGLQYDSCCWAMRAVASRTFKSLNGDNKPQYDTAFYIQWLLKGLGSLGSGNPGSLLADSIVGYKDPFKV
jgi:LPS-assembly protein